MTDQEALFWVKFVVGFYQNNGIILTRGLLKRGIKTKLVYFTYILLCSDHTLYIGWTDDLVRRIQVHNAGKGAKYTRARLPVKLLYWEKYATKKAAMRREYDLKQWRREEKLLLLEEKAGFDEEDF